MGTGHIFLYVVHDQMPVAGEQVFVAPRLGQNIFPEHLDLQRKVEQIMGQAIGAKAVHTRLSLVVKPFLRAFSSPGSLEPRCNLGVWKTDDGGLVQVIDDLAAEAVAAKTITLFNDVVDNKI